MPVARDGTVHFSTTLLALVRESLDIKMGPGTLIITTRVVQRSEGGIVLSRVCLCVRVYRSFRYVRSELKSVLLYFLPLVFEMIQYKWTTQ